MKHFLLLLLFSLISSGSYAQKLYRQYLFHQQPEGNVYFIYPQKGFQSTDKEAVKDLVYDITYYTKTDSATFIFSWFTKQVVQARSIQVKDQTGNVLYEAPVEMLFTQPKSKYWQQRGQFLIPYELLTQLYNNPHPFTLTLTNGKEIVYTIKPKKWKKQAEMTNKIFEVIKYNR